ncbi:MAG TPA: SufS family cysteine desulfurase [Phycisphaerae bacterium]|jgi:cysteine desulfurase/selenocysteine lyase
MATFNPHRIRGDFPIFRSSSLGKPLVYLDNGATTQKPQSVIDALSNFYASQNSNIHRGIYQLSQTATALYEKSREKIQRFIHAAEPAEIIFTRGTTESINLVASSWGRKNLLPGDTILLSHLEHHSNIVPWQLIAQETGAQIRVIPINDAGELLLDEYRKLLALGTVKLVAVNHISNSLGTINPVAEIIQLAHASGALVLIDGAQAVAHGITHVQNLDADFYAFSGHKMMGPTGIGVLYGKRRLLQAMPPYQGGGDMIASVSFEKTTYAELPSKFEAGTPHIAGVVGLAAAVDYLTRIDLAQSAAYEHELLTYATPKLLNIPGLKIIGTAKNKSAIFSFIIDSPHGSLSTLDIGNFLDRHNIAIRTGHHCCQPVMDRFGIPATARASLAFYNTTEEIDALVAALESLVAQKKPAQTAVPSQNLKDTSITYPQASAESVQAAADNLASEFEFLGDRDSKNQYVLDMAAQLPHLFDLLKQVTPRIQGCMSQVHLLGRKKAPSSASEISHHEPILEFVADADAEIVRGLIALLQRLYSGQPVSQILSFDIESFFQKIGLDQFITSQRRNGLAGMVAEIRRLAQNLQSQAAAAV